MENTCFMIDRLSVILCMNKLKEGVQAMEQNGKQLLHAYTPSSGTPSLLAGTPNDSGVGVTPQKSSHSQPESSTIQHQANKKQAQKSSTAANAKQRGVGVAPNHEILDRQLPQDSTHFNLTHELLASATQLPQSPKPIRRLKARSP